MKKNLLRKIIVLILIFSLAMPRPVWVLAQGAPTAPTAPSAPTAPTAPTAPSAPTAPTAPTAPSLPASAGQQNEEPAVVNEASNNQTGAGSSNQSSVDNQTNTDVVNENTGEVVNEVNSQTITGGNTASYNTGGGQITTGNAVQNLQVITNLNQNSTLYSANGSPLNKANNLLTGSGSANNSEVTNKLNETISNNNIGSLTNKILLNSVSGQNFSSYNTGVGSVKTGDSFANLSLLSSANTNVTGIGGMKTFNVFGPHAGDIVFNMDDFKDGVQFNAGSPGGAYENASRAVAENSVTGADSQNNSQAQSSTDEKISSSNQAVLKNEIVINAVSGNNNTVKNSGPADVETGKATAIGALVNFLNTNLVVDEWAIGVVNIFGELVGDIVLPKNDSDKSAPETETKTTANTLTGADSINNNKVSGESSKSFSNYNNAEVINNVDTNANTGGNTASYNTGPGQVKDGDALVNTQEATLANNNIIAEGETFWLVLVNKMGEWVGQIVGSESGETIAGNLVLDDQAPNFTDGSMENLEQAANLAIGPGSQNNSDVSNEDSLEVTNTNDAKIVNDIKINAQSGSNSGSYNTLGGEIEAGDAAVGLSLVNFVNNNFVGKKLVVLVIDVMGKWVGDVVPPDQEQRANGSSQNSGDENSSANDKPTPGQTGEQTDELSLLSDNGFNTGFGAYSEPSIQQTLPISDSSLGGYDDYYDFNAGYGGFNFGPLSGLRGASNQKNKRVNFWRGLFVSPVFAKEASVSGENDQTAGRGITEDWFYVLLPSFFSIVALKNKKVRTFLASFL